MSNNTYPKVSIRTLDLNGGSIELSTQYNPKELSFTKAVNWSDMGTVGTDYPSISFEKGNAIDLSVELFFDKYEIGGDVREEVRKIVQLCQINECKECNGDIAKRPPKVELLWGDGDALGIGKKFQGVMTSAQTKYTMFTSSGIPCRASVTVTIKQADVVGYASVGEKGVEQNFVFENAAQLSATKGAQEYFESKGMRVEDMKYPAVGKLGSETGADE
jgi:hypothetical protein